MELIFMATSSWYKPWKGLGQLLRRDISHERRRFWALRSLDLNLDRR